MHSPQNTLDSAVDRAAEITWWNRQLTKLNDVVGDEEASSFVENDIVERKGPYVEFVDAPKFHDKSAATFLEGLDYSDELIDAVTAELFGGDRSGSLYQHQAETIDAIASDDDDNILAVPTATGKTESFFFPILDHCLSTDEPGLKSLIVYPMKTLGVDQLNRFIAYLDEINRHRKPEDRITIGIWDGDTPTRVGIQEHEIEEGSFIRGLECPREEGAKLRVLSDMTVGTEDNEYSWIRVTRDAVRNGADILLTNPEALDHMFVSNNADTRSILGEDPGKHPVEHIVFDEAHVWSGISGSSVRLLSERLKNFYADRDPQITMVSATVDNPKELAHKLTGTPPSSINSIGFTERTFPVNTAPEFTRLQPTGLPELSGILTLAHIGGVDAEVVRERGLANALETTTAVGLVSTDDGTVSLAADTDWVTPPLVATTDQLVNEGGFDTREEVAFVESGREQLAESLLEAGGLDSEWFEFVVDAVPEAAEFASWFDEESTGEVGFEHYDELAENVSVSGVEDAEGVLNTIMVFGRLAGMVTEKYHVFLKPPHKVFRCENCDSLSRDKRCQACSSDEDNLELQFCKRCHYPYVAIDQDSERESAFRPYDHSGPADDCPGCGQWPQLTDIGVPTSSLLSYMLTEVCRASPSKKTLVFSDSHGAAESVGDRIIGTEYGLMAQTLYLQELIENDGVANNYELFRDVSDRLREAYWEPLIQNEIDEDGTAFNFLKTLRGEIDAKAMLSNADDLLDSALVTADVLTDFEDSNDLVIAHETYKLFATDPNVGFDKNTVSFEGLTLSKIVSRVTSRSGYPYEQVEEVVPTVLRLLIEERIIVESPWDEVRQQIVNSAIDDDRKEETFDFIEEARDGLDAADITNDEPKGGILTRIPKRDTSDLRLLESVAFCPECYRSYPVVNDGIDCCTTCGTGIDTFRRFRRDEDGTLVATPGYAEADTGWPYAVDHWAHDVTRPIRDGSEPEFVTVGIHKGNIPPTLRGAIEEGFRKDNPDINIVSATPTMELGVDIGSLDTVSQVGIPPTLTNYVQRSGRTGRTRGSSSLVMTAVRGEHPVDGHYYSNLESFFAEFEPVRVPNPYEFDELLTSHVVTETIAYLARNPHPTNIFNRLYKLNEDNQNLRAFVDDVENNLEVLTDFLLEEQRGAVERHIQSIFGERGVEAFEAAFVGDGPLSVEDRVEKTFSKATALSGSGETNQAFTENNNRLDQWLNRLGYLANYRSFGQQFPVKFQGRGDDIQFEGSGRLYDMFPGPENSLGAVISLHGTEYIVDDVRGSSTPLTTVHVCTNEECEQPFDSYDLDVERCPFCETDLKEVQIHEVSSVECKPARGGQKMINTRSLLTTDISSGESQAEQERMAVELFDTACEATYESLEITDFVYAYERRHSASPDKQVHQSQALIEGNSSSKTAGKSWQERLDETDSEEYAPVGQQYHTLGVTLQVPIEDVRDRLEALDEEATWSQALVSLEQALKKAVAVTAQCDLSDFRVEVDKLESAVQIRIVDSRQGGNGIAWQVWQALDKIAEAVASVADCDRCNDYCDECLLLERTPAHYLENDLLNHQTLTATIGANTGQN